MSTPLVSVVIATYNRAHFIGEAILSVLDQTVQDSEIIVVDDGSTDATSQVLAQFGGRIQVVRQLNQGRSGARNSGVSIARADIIAFLDSDDIWMPDKLAEQLSLFDAQPAVGLAHTFSDVVDENGVVLRKQTRRRQHLYRDAVRRGYTYEGMSQQCTMFLSTVAIRRECWESVGLMDTNIPAFEDWDWYLRVALNTKIDTIPEVLVHFRQHVGNTSSEEFFEGRLKTCQKHLALLDKWSDSKLKGLPRCNFYLQLAGAYYVQGHTAESVSWMRKAVLIDKLVLLRPSCLRYSLAMLFPAVIVSFGRWLGRLLSGEVRHESS